MIRAAIIDPFDEQSVALGPLRAMRTVPVYLPIGGVGPLAVPLTEFFRDDSGSEDMRVDGSTTPVPFSIKADPKRDRFIKNILFTVADQGLSLSDFANIGVLTNGLLFEWEAAGETVEIATLNRNYDLVRLARGRPSFGDFNSAFIAPNVIGNAEALIAAVDLEYVFGMVYGLRLQGGSTQEIRVTVRDDLSTGIDLFNIEVTGFDLIPEA